MFLCCWSIVASSCAVQAEPERPTSHRNSPNTSSLCAYIHIFIYTYVIHTYTGGSFLSLGLGQSWTCLDLLPLLPLLFGIALHLQLVLLSYHPIFIRPYHFLKLVSFPGGNRIKSASVCLWLLWGAI